MNQLTSDLYQALKAKDSIKVSTLRFLLADIKKYEIDHYPPQSKSKLSQADIIKVIRKQVKNHQESITAFKQGNRQDLVDKETQELAILQQYLPAEMDNVEICQIVKQAVGKVGKNFGAVMSEVMSQAEGRADGKKVAEIVKQEINK